MRGDDGDGEHEVQGFQFEGGVFLLKDILSNQIFQAGNEYDHENAEECKEIRLYGEYEVDEYKNHRIYKNGEVFFEFIVFLKFIKNFGLYIYFKLVIFLLFYKSMDKFGELIYFVLLLIKPIIYVFITLQRQTKFKNGLHLTDLSRTQQKIFFRVIQIIFPVTSVMKKLEPLQVNCILTLSIRYQKLTSAAERIPRAL